MSEKAHAGKFKDYFSRLAPRYVKFRPRYPDALFKYLASRCSGFKSAVDCATGSGQAAHGLAGHFHRVIAADASEHQITHAMPHEKISYVVARAERLPLKPRSVNFMMVAQALHWFNFEKFYAEVRRVLKPDGVFAASCYHWTHITPEVDAVRKHYKDIVVGPYWTPERRLVDEMYRTIPFPLDEIPSTVFSIEARWTMDDLVGYFETWSATQRYKEKLGQNPVDVIRNDLVQAWGNPDTGKIVRWPLYLRIGRV